MTSSQPIPRLSRLILGLLALPATTALGAEETSVTLDPLLVTASSVAQTQLDAPASISVITRDEIEQQPVQELAELLGTVEGVTLSRSGNLVPGVQIRGMGQAYTLLLIDGRRVNSTNVMFRGNDYDTGWVPVTSIERIEVVRGPMSSLYGSDAIGGVVNIITRDIGETWEGTARVDTQIQEDTEAGNATSVSLNASGPLIQNTLGLRLSATYDRREEDGDINDSGLDGMQSIDNRLASGVLVWTPNDAHKLEFGLDTSRRDHDGFVLEREAGYLRHRGDYGFGYSDVTLNLDETRNLVGAVTGEINPNKANSTELTGKLVVPWGSARQIVTLGGDYRHETLKDPTNLSGWPGATDDGTDPEAEVSQHAFFVEDEIAITETLSLTLGDRFDDHENFGGHHSPRAYLVYRAMPGISVKGGWAKAFRAPTLLQNSPNWGSVSCGSATEGCYIVGNPDLKPETSTSTELGVQFDQGRFGGGVTLFYSELEDMIGIDNRTSDPELAPTYPNFVGFLDDGRPIFAYENIDSVRSQGVEASLSAQLTPEWSLSANYTYTDIKDTSGDEDAPLAYRPDHVANLSATWNGGGRWSVNGSLRYTGVQYISVWSGTTKSPYVVADLTLTYRVDPRLTLRAGILNLADEGTERDASADYNEDGRRLFLSIAANF